MYKEWAIFNDLSDVLRYCMEGFDKNKNQASYFP